MCTCKLCGDTVTKLFKTINPITCKDEDVCTECAGERYWNIGIDQEDINNILGIKPDFTALGLNKYDLSMAEY